MGFDKSTLCKSYRGTFYAQFSLQRYESGSCTAADKYVHVHSRF